MAKISKKPQAVLYLIEKSYYSNNVMDSCEIQEKILTEYCKIKGYDILKVYKENRTINFLSDLTESKNCQLAKIL